jgi:dephospho-CoA kinase
MIIGVVGLNGSGKDTFAEYIVKKYKFVHKDLGQEIRDQLRRFGRNHLDRNEMISLGNERRQRYGADYWVNRAIENVRGDMIITSIRNPAEIEKIVLCGGVVVEISANIKTRYARTVERVKTGPNTHGDIGSFEEFKGTEIKELENPDPSKQQLLKCIEMAKYHISNNLSINKLHKKTDELFKKLLV